MNLPGSEERKIMSPEILSRAFKGQIRSSKRFLSFDQDRKNRNLFSLRNKE